MKDQKKPKTKKWIQYKLTNYIELNGKLTKNKYCRTNWNKFICRCDDDIDCHYFKKEKCGGCGEYFCDKCSGRINTDISTIDFACKKCSDRCYCCENIRYSMFDPPKGKSIQTCVKCVRQFCYDVDGGIEQECGIKTEERDFMCKKCNKL